MRINKLFSNMGICSRRETNRLIEDGRVTVNGEKCILGQWVELEDEILIDNVPIKEREKVYLLFNKPRGVVCTAEKTVENNIIDYLNYPQYIFPVGRLDKESEGLILLTNHGDLANMLLNSENYHEKEYIVKVDKEITEDFINKMESGVEILQVKTRPCKVKKIDSFTFKIILTQGLNRQIRRMTKALGYNVISLKRIRIVNLNLGDIPLGEYREIDKEELNVLRKKLRSL